MTEKELAEELRKKYMLNPPEGMTSDDIRYMSVGDLLDMDYFLNDEDTDDVGEEGFYISNLIPSCFVCPLYLRASPF